MGTINIFNYSTKAIAVTGDTKPIKNLLKSMGGRFNPRLVHPKTGATFMGWIFSAHRLTELEAMLTGNRIKFERTLPDNINSESARDYIQDPGEIDADNFCQRNNI